MEKLYLDLAVILFFLVALVILSGIKSRVKDESKRAFALLSTGISVLALMSVITAVQNQLAVFGVFGKSAIAAGEFFRLVLLISGLMLTASGVSKWLGILNVKQSVGTVVEPWQLRTVQLKRLNQLLSERSSLDDFLSSTLVFFNENLRLSAGTVYSISLSKNKAQLVAACGTFDSTDNLSQEFVTNPEWFEKLDQFRLTPASVSFAELHPNAGGSCFCFPIQLSSRRLLLYLLWTTDRESANSFDSDTLKSISESIKIRVQHEHLSIKQEFKSKCESIAVSLKEHIAAATTLHQMIRTVKREIQPYLPADFVSISSIHSSGICRRISIGPSDTLLSEIDTKFGSEKNYVNQVNGPGQVIAINDMAQAAGIEFPRLLTDCGIKSVLVLSLSGAGNSRGVLTIGSGQCNQISNAQLELMKMSASAFELILNEMNLIEYSAIQTESEKFLREFVSDITGERPLESIFQTLSATISQVVGCPLIRVSSVDSEGKYLTSHALFNGTKSKVRTPECAHLILSLLYWHNVARENGNTVIVNCNSSKNGMPSIETMQVFSAGVRRAVIVPIKGTERVLGLISLADDKTVSDSTLTGKNIEFVETLAAMAGLAIESQTRRKEVLAEFSTMARGEISESTQRRGIRSQLRSSLTSIMGSLEMIRSHGGGDETQKDRFLEIIDRSARKLSEIVKD